MSHSGPLCDLGPQAPMARLEQYICQRPVALPGKGAWGTLRQPDW